MDIKPQSVHLAGFISALFCASSAAAFAQEPEKAAPEQAQPEPQDPAPAATQPPASPQLSAPQPLATQPPADAPGYPPADNPPPGYALPPGYAPPPGYYPPPGYGPPPCYCQPPGYLPAGTLPGHHVHDGFYMRLTTGVGVLNAKDRRGGQDRTISGSGLAMSFALGGALSPHLILYGEMLVSQALDPKVDAAGSSQALGYDLNLSGIGPGVAYYLVPLNMYLSATLAFSKVSQSSTNNGSNSARNVDITEVGVGMSFMVGKEWWVSQDWGLGLAGQLHLASMKTKPQDAGTDDRMTATALSLLFSATYN